MLEFISGIAFTLAIFAIRGWLVFRSTQTHIISVQDQIITDLKETIAFQDETVTALKSVIDTNLSTTESAHNIITQQQGHLVMYQLGMEQAQDAAKHWHQRCVEAGIAESDDPTFPDQIETLH